MAKRKKDDLHWVKETLELKPNHAWDSPPEYKIFGCDSFSSTRYGIRVIGDKSTRVMFQCKNETDASLLVKR